MPYGYVGARRQCRPAKDEPLNVTTQFFVTVANDLEGQQQRLSDPEMMLE